MSGMNWRRSHYQTRIRKHGSEDWHGGSIDRAVALWGEYTADSRGIGAVSMGDFKAF